MTGKNICFASFVLVLVCWYANAEVPQLQVTTSSNGDYTLLINGHAWLASAPTTLHTNSMHHSTANGTLKLIKGPEFSESNDRLGECSVTSMHYGIRDGPQQLHAHIKEYKQVPAVVFSQSYPYALHNTSVGNKNSILSSFPSFQISNSNNTIGYMVYGDLMIGYEKLKIGQWNTKIPKLPDGLLSGPLLLFDKGGNVIIISAFSEFMVNSYYHDNNTVGWGIMGDINYVPESYTIETVVFYSSKGINKAIQEWGELLRYYYKRHQDARRNDISVNYIGYYTDNGAYYYHATEPHMTYEETIIGVYEYSKNVGIPYRYIQYDDWFYPIEGPGYGATLTWDALPAVFPHGLQYVYNHTGLPVVAHNRYWSHKTTYAKQNGGKFNFVIDESVGEAIPDDQDFWDYLFSWSKQWGLVVYEQDWLNHQLEDQRPLYGDISRGRRWLLQMGESAKRYGLQLQYCMCLPRELMQSLEVPAVSHARASGDYTNENQFRIGITSMFADAMGVAPFKDNFWSSSVQPGNHYKRIETNVLREAAVSLLSTGPVGPSDRIGYSNVSLIKRLVREDGLLLKPSRPATAIDQQIYQSAFGGDLVGGELWSTYCAISGLQFGIVMASELPKPYSLPWGQLGFENNNFDQFVYPLDMGEDSIPQPFSNASALMLNTCGKDLMCLYYTTPQLSFRNKTVLLLGELDKLVPMSPQRVSSVVRGTNDIKIKLAGTPEEAVFFTVWMDEESYQFGCRLNEFGSATIRLANKICH